MLRTDTIRREARGIASALVIIAVTTLIAVGLQHYLGIRRGSTIYLLAVLLAGWHFGLLPALVTALAGVLLSGYLFYATSYSFWLAPPPEFIDLVLFLVVALVASHLANSMRVQTEIARKRETEMSALYAFSRRLAAAPTAADIYRAIEDHLAAHAQRRVALFGAGPGGPGDGTAGDASVPDRVRAAIADIQGGSSVEATVGDDSGDVWLIRRVSQKTPDFGVIAINLGKVPAAAAADVRQWVNDMLIDAADTLERLDVAHALHEAKMRSETEHLREALIGSVSHELRTPLASILGAATGLHNALTLAGDPRLLSLTSVVRDEAERLNIDIQNLLDATTISRHQVRPKLQWVEPVDIVNAAFEHRRRRLSGYPVTFDLHSNLPIVHVDPAQVEQALVQIIDNAAKYSPAGSPIRGAAHPNGQTVMLSGHDRGWGLTTDEKRQVGGRFFRGPRHKVTTSGSGLGLWIAKAFVTANGGKVEVESDGADRGTTVTIHLPMSPEAEPLEMTVDE